MSKTQGILEQVIEYKDKGNDCIKTEKYTEAILHYSFAIKLENTLPLVQRTCSAQLHSNRSLAFLKLQHFYQAYQDANDVIILDPVWAKGYFRRAEVEFATKHYEEAIFSYRKASQLQADPILLQRAILSNKNCIQQNKIERQAPWVAAGLGLILGVLVVVADAVIPNVSALNHPLMQVFITICVSMFGLFLGKCYSLYEKKRRKSLLEPPAELLGENNTPSQNGEFNTENDGREQEVKKPHVRYTKSQARQRYKKGKS